MMTSTTPTTRVVVAATTRRARRTPTVSTRPRARVTPRAARGETANGDGERRMKARELKRALVDAVRARTRTRTRTRTSANGDEGFVREGFVREGLDDEAMKRLTTMTRWMDSLDDAGRGRVGLFRTRGSRG